MAHAQEALVVEGHLGSGVYARLKAYYELTKPERTYANVITGGAGFLLAAKGHVDAKLLIALLLGMSLLVASACVLNNYFDRGLDAAMPRTRHRQLPRGTIAAPHALIYSLILGFIGAYLLAHYVGWLVLVMGVVAYFDYVVLYGITKRRSYYGTLVGTVSGAMPMAAGYVAVTGHIDSTAALLFLGMVLWQMAHFYAIAVYRLKDYRAGSIPVLPAVKGVALTKRHILLYVLAFMVVSASLTVRGATGLVYAIAMMLLGGYWFWRGNYTYQTDKDELWARRMFLLSLKVLLGWSLLLALGPLLP